MARILTVDDDENLLKLVGGVLEANGYENIFRFAGGLRAWEASGYDLVGEMVA